MTCKSEGDDRFNWQLQLATANPDVNRTARLRNTSKAERAVQCTCMSIATANTTIATGALKQGRSMAGHGGQRPNMAKAGCARAALRCLSHCKWGKRKGNRGVIGRS
jgi:hypothetical protein